MRAETGTGGAGPILAGLLALAAFCPAESARAASPPANRTYFAIFLGLHQDPYKWLGNCIHFSRDEVCALNGDCGPWFYTENDGPESGVFEVHIEGEEHGLPLRLDAEVRMEGQGKKHSLGGAGIFHYADRVSNVSFTAKPIGKKSCPVLLEEWIHKAQGPRACVDEANFGPFRESLYVLPYPVGDAYIINQTYCSGISHWFGYDFGMPIGSRIVAARGGTVQEAREDLPDDGVMHDSNTDNSGNFVTIRHEDGSLATYAHMAEDSLVIEAGDTVAAGQLLGLSGYSGNADRPHLHFDVIDGNGRLLPINFRNSRGKLDPRGGLMQSVVYEALRY